MGRRPAIGKARFLNMLRDLGSSTPSLAPGSGRELKVRTFHPAPFNDGCRSKAPVRGMSSGRTGGRCSELCYSSGRQAEKSPLNSDTPRPSRSTVSAGLSSATRSRVFGSACWLSSLTPRSGILDRNGSPRPGVWPKWIIDIRRVRNQLFEGSPSTVRLEVSKGELLPFAPELQEV